MNLNRMNASYVLKTFRKELASENFQLADIYFILLVSMAGSNLKWMKRFINAHCVMEKYPLRKSKKQLRKEEKRENVRRIIQTKVYLLSHRFIIKALSIINKDSL